jgi:exopolysaccharide biosynthesis polyprenyl glycosylphosphotransferase
MAVSEIVDLAEKKETSAGQGRRAHAVTAPPRLALGLLVPCVDGLMLATGGIIEYLQINSGRLSLAYPVGAFILLLVTGSYQSRILPRLSEDLLSLLGKLSLAAVILAFLIRPSRNSGLLAASVYRYGAFLTKLYIPILLAVLGRAFAYAVIREARAHGQIREPTLIIGARNLGVKVAKTLLEHAEYGLIPIGFLDSISDAGLPLPILGNVSDLETVVKSFGVRRVIVAFGAMRESEMVKTLRASDQLPVEVHVVPRFFELGVAPEGPFTDNLWGIVTQRLRRSALRTVAWRTKRIFDLLLASILLILCLPLMAACALAVRLSSPGPIFFKQRRIGQRAQVFKLLKFRTMVENDDSETTWSVSDDERITRVGRVLRASSLDELPQLINVLRGEMSLVGPRPERPHYVDRFRVAVQGYDDRHRVPTGMTGWAQVHGLRGDTSIPDRAMFDNYYVEHWSLWHDMMILLRTAGQIVKRGGA